MGQRRRVERVLWLVVSNGHDSGPEGRRVSDILTEAPALGGRRGEIQISDLELTATFR
jgi:hypothetical protein